MHLRFYSIWFDAVVLRAMQHGILSNVSNIVPQIVAASLSCNSVLCRLRKFKLRKCDFRLPGLSTMTLTFIQRSALIVCRHKGTTDNSSVLRKLLFAKLQRQKETWMPVLASDGSRISSPKTLFKALRTSILHMRLTVVRIRTLIKSYSEYE